MIDISEFACTRTQISIEFAYYIYIYHACMYVCIYLLCVCVYIYIFRYYKDIYVIGSPSPQANSDIYINIGELYIYIHPSSLFIIYIPEFSIYHIYRYPSLLARAPSPHVRLYINKYT